MKCITKNFGFSLIEIIIVSGLMSALGLGLATLMKNMHKGQVSATSKVEELEIRRIIIQNLTDKIACTNTFSGLSIGSDVLEIKSSANNVLYKVNNSYGDNSIKISRMYTSDKNQLFSDGTRNVDLKIELAKTKQMATPKLNSFSIQLRVKAPGPTGIISSCYADQDAIIEQTCTTLSGIWTGSNCILNQYVLKTGDTMSGTLTAPLFSGNIQGSQATFSTNLTTPNHCTGSYCKSMTDLALANRTCPLGQVQKGVQLNGDPNCIPLSCPPTFFFAGLDLTGSPICRPLPTNTCPTNEYISEVRPDGTVVCSPVPFTATATCPIGQVLQSISGGTPTCTSKGPNTSCPIGQFISGIAADGNITCNTNTLAGGTCPPGQVMKGITPAGSPICGAYVVWLCSCGGGANKNTDGCNHITGELYKCTSPVGGACHQHLFNWGHIWWWADTAWWACHHIYL